MPTITKTQFLKDVAAEARALKKHATTEEIQKLDNNSLTPQSMSNCIYGQLTGNCASPRASVLIWNCCTRYIEMTMYQGGLPAESFSKLKKHIIGKKPEGISNAKQLRRARPIDFWKPIKFFSSIEGYILLPNAKTKNLIAYLKGETKKLVL